MERIGQGRTAEIYAYSNEHIMKLYRMDFPHEAVQNEFRISELAYKKGLPVPQAVSLIEHTTSRAGIVFERIQGITLLSLIIQQPELLEQLAFKMADCHYRLHCERDDEGTLPSQKQILSGAIHNIQLLSEDDQAQVLSYLTILPDQQQICHGDFHPDNVMLSEAGDQYWVIDWMTGMSGDPAGDVARSWVILMSATLPEDTDPAIRMGFEKARESLVEFYIHHYMQLSGITREAIESWMLPVAAARLDEDLPAQEVEQLLKFVQERIRLLDESNYII
ncbi:aminoglycoside phosphotransferase family protein [Paenibacillus sp. FSL R5-0623]|uniref:phosphotransferase family protein n=1 Tax=Paenibacillus sp. FSL R5-0623 TaxID=2921651 RepID=UPI0030D8A77F